jgi:hypothetical protein
VNPFKHGQIVTGEDFCGRNEEVRVLRERISSGQNVVLYGERRCGKSSLIAEAARRSRNRKAVFVDFLNVRSVDDACKRIAAGILKLEKAEIAFRKVGKALAALRPKLTMDPLTGSPSLGFEPSVRVDADTVVGALSLLEELSRTHRLVVVFDEFQGLLGIPESDQILALMRGEIQRQGKLCYIFAGSVRHDMYAIFSDPNSPFFKSATIMNVSVLKRDAFTAFLEDRFAGGKRTLSTAAADLVFESVSDVPGDVQHLCEAIWDTTDEKQVITPEHVQNGMRRILCQYAEHFQTILTGLTEFQIRCLATIAWVGGDHISSNAFLKHGGFTNASSVKSAVRRLCKLGILTEQARSYRFINPFIAAWLREHIL